MRLLTDRDNTIWNTIHKAKQAYEIIAHEDKLEITVPTEVIVRRGQTLNLPVLFLEISSPRNDVIRVQIVHHDGQAKS